MKKKHRTPSEPVNSPQTARTTARLAGFRRRLVSMLYEVLLLLGILAATFIVPYVLLGLFMHYIPPGWLMWLHVFAVLGMYFVWYWSRNGQTLAMQTWRLKLVTTEGKALSRQQACCRYVLAWPSLWCCGLGLLWALVDRDRQFLHDRLAGSCIVLLDKT